jgi:hypothetical protein
VPLEIIENQAIYGQIGDDEGSSPRAVDDDPSSLARERGACRRRTNAARARNSRTLGGKEDA